MAAALVSDPEIFSSTKPPERRRSGATSTADNALQAARDRGEDPAGVVTCLDRSGAGVRQGRGDGGRASGSSRRRGHDPCGDDRQARRIYVDSATPRKLAAALIAGSDVLGVQIDGGTVRVETSDAADLAPQIASIAVDHSIDISKVEPVDESGIGFPLPGRGVVDPGPPSLPTHHAPGRVIGLLALLRPWLGVLAIRIRRSDDGLITLYTDVLARSVTRSPSPPSS